MDNNTFPTARLREVSVYFVFSFPILSASRISLRALASLLLLISSSVKTAYDVILHNYKLLRDFGNLLAFG